MAKWLESGTRRDMCALLYAAGELRGQELKRRLEQHHGDRIRPERFHSRLDALESSGHVAHRVEGLEDVYELSDAGEAALRDHYEWLSECVAAGDDSGETAGAASRDR